MAKVSDIFNYEPKTMDSYFFDTNVWIYIFCPIANSNKKAQQRYSGFYQQLLRGKHAIFVNSLVISEFANAYLRIDFNLWKKEERLPQADYKKDFVKSERFNNTVLDVKSALNNILKRADKMTDNFNAIDFQKIYSEFGKCDFNDAYYIELARMNSWKIVTHDADFFLDNSSNIEIITANY
jgi:predicted nucleic acid-binding protein